MSRPVIVASMAGGSKVLVRMAAEGGAVEVYRLYLGRWERDAAHLEANTQVEYDAPTNVVTITQLGKYVSKGVKMGRLDAKTLLKKRGVPSSLMSDWTASDEAAAKPASRGGDGSAAARAYESRIRADRLSRTIREREEEAKARHEDQVLEMRRMGGDR